MLLCADNATRVINRDDLAKWAGSPVAIDRKFESHAIYYDEVNKDRLMHTHGLQYPPLLMVSWKISHSKTFPSLRLQLHWQTGGGTGLPTLSQHRSCHGEFVL